VYELGVVYRNITRADRAAADGLAALGFKQEPSTGAAKLYKLTDLPAMYAAMVAHIEAVQAKQAA